MHFCCAVRLFCFICCFVMLFCHPLLPFYHSVMLFWLLFYHSVSQFATTMSDFDLTSRVSGKGGNRNWELRIGMGIGTGTGAKIGTGIGKRKGINKMSSPQLFKRWIAPSTGQISIQWIRQLVSQKLIRCIVLSKV